MKASAADIARLTAGQQVTGVNVAALAGGVKVAVPTPAEIVVAAVREWCRGGGVPEPLTEHPFAEAEGRLWRWDMAWPHAMLAVEIQGGVYSGGRHTRPKGFAGDCEKFSAGAVLGWRLMPVTYEQCNDGRLLEWLAAALFIAPSASSGQRGGG